MCQSLSDLYDTVANFREELLRKKSLLRQEFQKFINSEDERVRKLAGKHDFSRQKL